MNEKPGPRTEHRLCCVVYNFVPDQLHPYSFTAYSKHRLSSSLLLLKPSCPPNLYLWHLLSTQRRRSTHYFSTVTLLLPSCDSSLKLTNGCFSARSNLFLDPGYVATTLICSLGKLFFLTVPLHYSLDAINHNHHAHACTTITTAITSSSSVIVG